MQCNERRHVVLVLLSVTGCKMVDTCSLAPKQASTRDEAGATKQASRDKTGVSRQSRRLATKQASHKAGLATKRASRDKAGVSYLSLKQCGEVSSAHFSNYNLGIGNL